MDISTNNQVEESMYFFSFVAPMIKKARIPTKFKLIKVNKKQKRSFIAMNSCHISKITTTRLVINFRLVAAGKARRPEEEFLLRVCSALGCEKYVLFAVFWPIMPLD
jgi:hypothetical protein